MQENPSLMSGVPWNQIEKTLEVHPSAVAGYVKNGWVILMAYNVRDDVTENTWEKGYQQNLVRSEYRPVVLMGQTILDALEEEVEQLRLNSVVLEKLQVEHAKLKIDLGETQKRAEGSAERVREMDTRWNEEFKRAGRAEERMRKLEGDIGRIRAAIGEIRMKEILEGDKKT